MGIKTMELMMKSSGGETPKQKNVDEMTIDYAVNVCGEAISHNKLCVKRRNHEGYNKVFIAQNFKIKLD